MATSVPFLVFPGVAGNYIETADTNLLDADTAHVQQSIGQAVNGFQAGSIQLSTDLAPVFGSSHGEATSSGTGPVVSLGPTSGPGIVPVTAGNTYAFAASMACAVATDAQLAVRWFDSGGGIISTPNVGSSVVLSPNTFAALTADAVAPSGAASCSLRLVWDNGVGAGNKVYWDAAMVAAGSAASFVPSLRIVGDLDVRLDLSSDWTLAGRYFMAVDSGTNRAWVVQSAAGAADRVLFRVWVGAAEQLVQSPSGVLTGRHLVQCTRVASSGVMTVFVDGVQNVQATRTAGAGDTVSEDLTVGSTAAGGSVFSGSMWFAEVRDGIDGPVVARMDASDAATATVT